MKKEKLPYLEEQGTPLWLRILVGMALGVVLGLFLRPGGMVHLEESTLATLTDWIMLPANLFLSMIMMIVMPLVFSSVLLAIAGSGGVSFLRKIGTLTLIYFTLTFVAAAIIGIFTESLFNPAKYVPVEWVEATLKGQDAVAGMAAFSGMSVPQVLSGLIPRNPMMILVEQQMLQIVLVALMTGIAVLSLPAKKVVTMISLFESAQAICMTIVGWAMYIAPVAVFGFLFQLTISAGVDMLGALAVYIGAVLFALLSLMLMYMAIVAFVARRPVRDFLREIRNVQLLAFSTSSSSAAMPLSIATAEKRLGIHPSIAHFVIPLGTTINMDGTSVYQIIVALFLAHLFGVDLSMSETVLLAVTIIAASLGVPGAPGASIAVLTAILAGLGVPAAAIGLVLGVDRLLDMCRTVINVTGDLAGTCVLQRFVSKKELERI